MPNIQKPLILQHSHSDILQHYTTMDQAGTRLSGVVFLSFWFSGEVKHFVHLIRWNLKAV